MPALPQINPAVAQHGGRIDLLDVEDGIVVIRMMGGCQGCGMANVTLKQGVEVEIKKVVPTIREVLDITHRHNISGVPVVDGNELVGIVTSRDMRFEKRLDDPVRNIMTGKADLVTVREDASQDEILQLLHRHRIEKVLVVNDNFELRGLITVKDILKRVDFPNQTTDDSGRLLCGAAVGVGDAGLSRLEALVEAGIDVVVIDTAHGHTSNVIETAKDTAVLNADDPQGSVAQFTDLLGIVKGITIPLYRLEESLEHGTWFDGSSIEGFVRIDAHVPLAEMFGYANVLRSATAGKAEFTMEFARYAPAPADTAEELRKEYLDKRAQGK